MTDVLVITGVSGAGRSTAAAVLEDLGWYVVDNLPTSLVEKIVELASAPGSGITKLALVAGRQHVDLIPKIALLRAAGHRVRLLYLEREPFDALRTWVEDVEAFWTGQLASFKAHAERTRGGGGSR